MCYPRFVFMLIIGSRAAKYWCSDFREPKDWDVICSNEELFDWQECYRADIKSLLPNSWLTKYKAKLIDGVTIEFEIIEHRKSSEKLWKLHRSENCKFLKSTAYVAPITSLILLKQSHIYHAIHWQKSIEDYHFLKKQCKHTPNAIEILIYKQRVKETEKLHGKNKAYLNQSNEKFFKKSSRKVHRYFIHDDLHTATCFYDKPLYQSLKYDPGKAYIDKDLFKELSLENKIKVVQEEAFAIGLERRIIPALMKNQPFDAYASFLYAIQKICTTLSPDWLKIFAVEHYPQIKNLNGYDFVSKFLEAKAQGLVRIEQ